MPMRWAMATTSSGPFSSFVTSWANTVFTENAVASTRSNVPDSSSSAFESVHGPYCPVSGSVV